jgi:hypothetical protein
MSSEQQPAADPASEPVPAVEPAPAPIEAAPPKRHWSAIEVWMLGIFSILGLAGFIGTFVLLLMRSPAPPAPHAAPAAVTQRVVGPQGERGPAGPAGARGPAGEPGIRIVRTECATGNCTAECAGDEVLLNAYCGSNHAQAAYPTEHSAVCRALGRKIEVVVACIKSSR